MDFNNFAQVGECFVQQAFFGDFTLLGILIAAMFLIMIVKYNFPMSLLIPFSSALFYVLWLLSGSSIFLGLLIISLILMGGIMIVGLVNYFSR